jgi:23S rRNA pseudouridine2604 synthase
MCEYLNYEVKQLKRVRIMNINLDIREGEWRYLTLKELKEMHRILKKSSKTAI